MALTGSVSSSSSSNSSTGALKKALSPQRQSERSVPSLSRPRNLPSLRYLELQLTSRCNLTCKHCYLGETTPLDLPAETILRICKEFERMQGLRLLLSGGEPMLHNDFWTLNDALSDFGLRSVLLSNRSTHQQSCRQKTQSA